MSWETPASPGPGEPTDIHRAVSPLDLDDVRELFARYAAELDVDLCFQGFQAELETLPGCYGAPDGALLLARVGGKAAGCVALRKLTESICEMKRLFVAREFRGRGLGRRLAEEIWLRARSMGYEAMRLDTLERLRAARKLYESMGFAPIEAYYANPLKGVVYLEKRIQPLPGSEGNGHCHHPT